MKKRTKAEMPLLQEVQYQPIGQDKSLIRAVYKHKGHLAMFSREINNPDNLSEILDKPKKQRERELYALIYETADHSAIGWRNKIDEITNNLKEKKK